jgi:hypothetical protein
MNYFYVNAPPSRGFWDRGLLSVVLETRYISRKGGIGSRRAGTNDTAKEVRPP